LLLKFPERRYPSVSLNTTIPLFPPTAPARELFPHPERLVRRFKRVHYSGTKAEISQHSGVWRVEIHLKEAKHNPMMITDYVPQSLALAKELADKEITKYGHVCNEACKDWIEVH